MVDPVRAAELTPTEGDVARLASRFGASRLKQIGGFENLLFRSLDPPGMVIRVTHTSRRSVGLVEAEVAFMHHLAHHGVPVVVPVPSVEGTLVTSFVFEDGSETVVHGMSEAPGETRHPRTWSDDDLVAMGELLGQCHVAAAVFDPPGVRRPAWTDDVFDPGSHLLDDREFAAAWRQIRAEAAAHPAGRADLLIHQDAHFGNVHIEDPARLTLFDFDDCAYGSAVHDVAMVFFYWLMVGWDDEVAETRRFFDRLLTGYRRHADLDGDWPDGVDRLLNVRQADIFLLISRNLVEWTDFERRWMHDRRRRVMERTPLVGSPLADLL